MLEKDPYKKEKLQLKGMVRSVSKNPELDDLPVLFLREEIRQNVQYVSNGEPSPNEMSDYFWGKNINAYAQKPLAEHLKDMGNRPKAVLVSFMVLSGIIGTVVAAQSENESAGVLTTAALASATLAFFRKLIQMSLVATPVSHRTQKFYDRLKKVYVMCQKLEGISGVDTYEKRAHALSTFQEAQELIIAMQREIEEEVPHVSGRHLWLVKND